MTCQKRLRGLIALWSSLPRTQSRKADRDMFPVVTGALKSSVTHRNSRSPGMLFSALPTYAVHERMSSSFQISPQSARQATCRRALGADR